MISANAALSGYYDYGEVARSVLIAVAASYGALDLAGRITAASGRVRLVWLSGGAIAMGIGIWAMHFKGMLAFHLPVPVEYHWPTVLASLVVAIFASAFALYVASREKTGRAQALAGSLIMGVGIAGMHYIGMAAMRLPAITRYSPLLVVCSILLAILFSLLALLMAFGLREETRWAIPRRLASATVMGAAVSAMHYTGMSAASFFPASLPDLSRAVSITPVGSYGVSVVTLIVLVAAIVTSSLDRRASAEIQRLNQDLERRVTERTLQLETINQALRKEIAERERAEEAVRNSEDRLRLVIDTIPQRIWSGAPDGSLDFFNAQWRSYTGLTQEELQGKGWQRVLHPDDRERALKVWRESVASGTPFEQEVRHRRADGQYRWFLVRCVPLKDSEGGIIRWYGTSTDIEDRKRAEDAVRRSEEHLRLVIDTVPAMLHSARPDGYVDFFNKRWLEYVGVSLEDISGWRWTHVIHPDDVEEDVNKWRSSVASGRPFETEARLRRADGEYRLMLLRKVPLRDEAGSIVKWYGSATDIEDRKRAEEELKASEEQHRVIVEAANDAVISMDENGRILLANPATARIFGYDPVELIGKPLTVLMPEFMRKLHEAGFRRYLASGERHLNWQGTEVTALRKNGQEFPVEVSFGEMVSNGHTAFTGFIRDISEKKRAEEMRAAHARQIAVRADASMAFGKEESLKTILGECSEAIVRHLDAAFARIWTLSNDGKMLELQASAGMYTHLDGPHSRIPMGQFKIGMIAQERKPCLTNDVLNDPRITDRAWAKKEGMASFAGYPLSVGDRTIGVMAMFSRKPVTPETTETLASGADLIAQGIERKRAEAELRESEARFRLVADSAPVMIWMSGTDKRFTYFNKPWLDFTGRSIEQELGNGWAEGVDPEDLQRCTDTYIQAFDRREAFRMEYRLRRHDGELRWVSDTGVPRFNPDGSFAGYIGSCVDVTDQRRAEEHLRRAQEDLARVSRVVAMGELAAAIAHEVNQPLTAIVTNGNFSLRQLESATPNPDELRAAIAEIVSDGTRASAVISRIRGLLMKGTPVRTELNINQIIHDVSILLHNDLNRNQVSFRTDLAADLPRVPGDSVQLQQVLINLIMNAVEAMRSSTGRTRELLIRSAKSPDGVLVQVQDSGPGMEPEVADHIFEPFFTTKAEGIGMGLSISRSIVESHGGRLRAVAEPNGALFEFTVPTQD